MKLTLVLLAAAVTAMLPALWEWFRGPKI